MTRFVRVTLLLSFIGFAWFAVEAVGLPPASAARADDNGTAWYQRKLNEIERKRIRKLDKLQQEHRRILERQMSQDLRKTQRRLDEVRRKLREVNREYRRDLEKLEVERQRRSRP
jgi:hypothetical protein